jgi:hypothetical protein
VNNWLYAYKEEWRELEDVAERVLKHPPGGPKRHNALLRIWRYPSFTPYTSWTVYRSIDRDKLDLFIRELIWDRPKDAGRFSNPLEGIATEAMFRPIPTITQRSVQTESIQAFECIESLQRILLPPFHLDGCLGVDGEGFGVETFNFANSSKLRWWSNPPQEWYEISKWHESASAIFIAELGNVSLEPLDLSGGKI